MEKKIDPLELKELKTRMKELRRRFELFQKRLSRFGHRRLPSGQRIMIAAVDTNKCVGCGKCYNVCPIGAIDVDKVASIDTDICAGCGLCVKACPKGAISLVIHSRAGAIKQSYNKRTSYRTKYRYRVK